MAKVPIVDMSLPEAECAALVRAACTGPGFMYVSNHGVAPELVEGTFERSRALFALPLEEKQRMVQDKNNRGWTPFEEETLDPANQSCGDTKEGFYFGREVAADSPEASKPLHGPNQWPPEALVPGLRVTYEEYFKELWALGLRIIRLIALSLDLPPTFFDKHFDAPIVSLRPLHYSGTVSAPEEGVFGAGAHTDYGMITLLVTDQVPGLQIHTGGAWHDVAPLPGTFIINLGDMLERWTNGQFHSTLLRVINTTGQERYSIAYFFEPSFDTVIECLPQCTGPDRPPMFPPTTSGQHLLNKYAQTHVGYTGPSQATDRK